jgi:hypothetical protein
MIKYSQYLTEAAQKNTHMEHLEDLVFNEGVDGTRKAITTLINMRNMLQGSSPRPSNLTVKWDGAPAIFAGIDPEDDQFFVAKKGIFNKNPQTFKSVEEIRNGGLSGELQSKFIAAFEEFSKLGIKKNVYQGDLMFTKEDLKTETINGEDFITFQPNTIVYAVPVGSSLAKKIRKARIGIVWHTLYSGKTLPEMSASFGKNIAKTFNDVSSVWQDDANYKDVSGTATFTDKETKTLTSILSEAGKIFRSISANALNDIAGNEEFLIRLKTFNNTKVRAGQVISDPINHVRNLVGYIREYYGKEMDKRKTDAGKQAQLDKQNALLKYFDKNYKDLVKIYRMVILLGQAKQMVVDKLNEAGSLKTFLRTRNGFSVTNQEGYVAIDKIGGAVKLVDRMEFSRANFSPDVIKGWQK